MHCLVPTEIITEDGCLHPTLQEFYNAYRAERGSDALSPRDWLPHTRGAARAWLEQKLGGNIGLLRQTSTPVLIDITSTAIPKKFLTASGTFNEHFRTLVRYLQRDDITRKLWDRMGVFSDLESEASRLLRETGQVSLGHLNILKGNIAEILSIPHQILALRHLQNTYPQTALVTEVRVRLPGSDALLLYSDNIIASFENGNIIVHHVFEVKSGFNGGLAGTNQVIKWDQRFEEGVELVISSDADVFRLPHSGETTGILRTSAETHLNFIQPGAAASAGRELRFAHNMPGTRQALELRLARRDVIGAFGQISISGSSAIGIEQALQSIPADVERIALGLDHAELDYLMKHILLFQD